MIPYKHRHVVMGMPSSLWQIYHQRPEAKKKLLKAAYSCVRQCMIICYQRDIMPGAMCVLHTFGRDLKTNCHIHMIITEGGYDDTGIWRRYSYLPFERKGKIKVTINELWRDAVLDILRLNLPRTQGNGRFLNSYRDHYPKGFYVYSPKENRIPSKMKAKNKAKYITRYVKHPVISDSRLLDYDGHFVTFWYDHPSTRSRIIVKMDVFEFLGKIFSQIPDKHFKLVLYYGLYSPKYRNKPSYQSIFNESGVIINPEQCSWRQRRLMETGVDPLVCETCGYELVLASVVFRDKHGYRIFYYLNNEHLGAIGYTDEDLWIIERNKRKSIIELAIESIPPPSYQQQLPLVLDRRS